MFDIITLGSATIDILVKSKNEKIKHNNHQDIAYHLGEKILINDLEFTTGGGATNTAVAFSRLGLKTGFIGILSNDLFGEFIAKELRKEKVEFLGLIGQGKPGISIILPGFGDRTILNYRGLNDLIEVDDLHLSMLNTKWLYISSVMGKSLKAAEKLCNLTRKGAKIAFNPSMYLAKLGLKKLSKILSHTKVLILNKEEAQALTGLKYEKEIIEKIAHSGPEIIVITDGPRKIYAYSDGEFFTKVPKKIKVIDSTGAGDAFASGFVYGIMHNKPLDVCLDLGLKESDSVITHIGAKNNLLRKL
jgi:ribokinase